MMTITPATTPAARPPLLARGMPVGEAAPVLEGLGTVVAGESVRLEVLLRLGLRLVTIAVGVESGAELRPDEGRGTSVGSVGSAESVLRNAKVVSCSKGTIRRKKATTYGSGKSSEVELGSEVGAESSVVETPPSS